LCSWRSDCYIRQVHFLFSTALESGIGYIKGQITVTVTITVVKFKNFFGSEFRKEPSCPTDQDQHHSFGADE
jgi:hypothetical protein